MSMSFLADPPARKPAPEEFKPSAVMTTVVE